MRHWKHRIQKATNFTKNYKVHCTVCQVVVVSVASHFGDTSNIKIQDDTTIGVFENIITLKYHNIPFNINPLSH